MLTHEASAVLAECWLHVRGLGKRVDEAHLAVKQRAGFHEVVNHLFPTDLPVSGEERVRRQVSSSCATYGGGGVDLSTHEHALVLVQLAELAEVREVVPDGFKLVPGNMAVAIRVKVLENRLEEE